MPNDDARAVHGGERVVGQVKRTDIALVYTIVAPTYMRIWFRDPPPR